MYIYTGGDIHIDSLIRKFGSCPKCQGPNVKIKKNGKRVCFLCYMHKQVEEE